MVTQLWKRFFSGARRDSKPSDSGPDQRPNMLQMTNGAPLAGRVRDMLQIYDNPKASAAYLLCDQYPAEALAYRVIGPDPSAHDLTYGELRARSERMAAGLARLGVGPGDRVATLMGKSIDYLVTLIAIWRIGAVHVPLFTAFAPPAIALRLAGSNANIAVVDEAQQAKLAPSADMPSDLQFRIVTTAAADRVPAGAMRFDDLLSETATASPPARLGGEAPMIQIFTSGTTGRPKGVVVPIEALANFRGYAEGRRVQVCCL